MNTLKEFDFVIYEGCAVVVVVVVVVVEIIVTRAFEF